MKAVSGISLKPNPGCERSEQSGIAAEQRQAEIRRGSNAVIRVVFSLVSRALHFARRHALLACDNATTIGLGNVMTNWHG